MLFQLQKGKDEVLGEKDKLASERDQFQKEAFEGRAAIQQRDMQVDELHKEVFFPETSDRYRKVTKFSDARKLCCNLPKTLIKRPNLKVFGPKDANETANSEVLIRLLF